MCWAWLKRGSAKVKNHWREAARFSVYESKEWRGMQCLLVHSLSANSPSSLQTPLHGYRQTPSHQFGAYFNATHAPTNWFSLTWWLTAPYTAPPFLCFNQSSQLKLGFVQALFKVLCWLQILGKTPGRPIICVLLIQLYIHCYSKHCYRKYKKY